LGARAVVWIGAGLVTIAVGASRLYLGAHWLTDVLGGYALGAAWVALVVAISLLRIPGHAGPRPPARWTP